MTPAAMERTQSSRRIPEPFRVMVDDSFSLSTDVGATIIIMPASTRNRAPAAQRKMPSLLGAGAGTLSFAPDEAEGLGPTSSSLVSSSRVMPKQSLSAFSFSSSGVDKPPSHFEIA